MVAPEHGLVEPLTPPLRTSRRLHPTLRANTTMRRAATVLMLLLFLTQAIVAATPVGCSSDSDCAAVSALNATSGISTYICDHGFCTLVVVAGQLCSKASDCAQYQWVSRKLLANASFQYIMGSGYTGTNDSAAYLASLCDPGYCTIASACSVDYSSLFNPANPLKLPTYSNDQACCAGGPTEATCSVFGASSYTVSTCGTDESCTTGSSTDLFCATSSSNSSTLWIGVVITIIGAAANNIGLNLQKLALRKRSEKVEAQKEEKRIMRLRIGGAKIPESFASSVKRNLPFLRSRKRTDDEVEAMADAAAAAVSGIVISDYPEKGTAINSISLPPVAAGGVDRGAVEDNLPIAVVTTVVGEDQPDLMQNLGFSNLIRNPIWVLGLIIYISANFLNFAALQFAPQSLVAPLGSISLVVNVIAAPLLNKEKFTWKDVVGGIFIVGGSSMTVVFAGVSSEDYNLCILLKLFQRIATIIFLTATMACIASTFLYICIVEKNLDHTPVVPAQVVGAAAATSENALNPPEINIIADSPSEENFGPKTKPPLPSTSVAKGNKPAANDAAAGSSQSANPSATLEWTTALYRNVYIPAPVKQRLSQLFQRPTTPAITPLMNHHDSPKPVYISPQRPNGSSIAGQQDFPPPPSSSSLGRIEEDALVENSGMKGLGISTKAAEESIEMTGLAIEDTTSKHTGHHILTSDTPVDTADNNRTVTGGLSMDTLTGGDPDAISVGISESASGNRDFASLNGSRNRKAADEKKGLAAIALRIYRIMPNSAQRAVDAFLAINFIPVLRRKIKLNTKVVTVGLPLAYASLGGLMGTTTTLFAKSTIHLLTNSFLGDNQFNSIYSWVIVAVTVFTAFAQVYWINMGLQRYDALLQIPVFFCVWTIFDVVGGGVYFGEFDGFTPRQYGLFILAIGVIFLGVIILADRLKRSQV
ncbi:hypothetical protein HDU82_008963 [Entophlyctis luteolus]|nr:hypothetical protein HDU82_008963 [Entophlyctis luteolus]